MKLIITRHGSGWGGAVGSAVIDLETEKIHYLKGRTTLDSFEAMKEAIEVYGNEEGKSIGEELEVLCEELQRLGLVRDKTDYVIDVQLLKDELSESLDREERKFFAFDSQEDYVVLENNSELELVYAEDNSRTVRLKNKEADKMIETLLKLVG